MARIDYYFTVLSPFTYLAGLRLEEIAAKHGAAIDYIPLDIMALFEATGGTPPPKRHVSRQEYRVQDLRHVAALNGMAINLKPAHWPTNPVPASCAVIACQQAGGDAGRLAHAFLAACWAGEKDIADPAVVAETLATAGLDAAALGPAMAAAEATYRANLDRAVAAGAFGSPFYVADGERFWGQDRLAHLDAHLAGG